MSQIEDGWEQPCYAISVVAEMVSLHPQTLRRYEELGLLLPARKAGRRLYSQADVEQVRYISRLTNELGLNTAGIEVILRLNMRIQTMQAELDRLQTVCAGLESQVAVLHEKLASPSQE